MYNIQYFVMNPYLLPSGNTVYNNKNHIVQLCDYIGSERLTRFISDNRLKAFISQVRDDLDEVNTNLNLGVLCNLIDCILALLFSNKFMYGINLYRNIRRSLQTFQLIMAHPTTRDVLPSSQYSAGWPLRRLVWRRRARHWFRRVA